MNDLQQETVPLEHTHLVEHSGIPPEANDVKVTSAYPETEQIYLERRKVFYEAYEPSCLQRCSNRIITLLETVFYNLGLTVARHTYLTIFIAISVCGICGVGLVRYKQTTDDAKLWVPKTSQLIPEKAWIHRNFPEEYRFTSYIVEAHNVLTPRVINAMYDMYLQSRLLHLPDLKNLDAICLKVGGMCNIQSLLELWQYDASIIRDLTMKDVLEKVNNGTKYSPMYGTEFSVEQMLGGLRRDVRGYIIGADTATIIWMLHNTPEYEAAGLDWERQMIDLANHDRPYVLKTYVYATRTFDDEGYGAVKADTTLLMAGFTTVFVFIIMVLGRFNCVENKFYVSLVGTLTIALSLLFCYGIAMACGLLYGPIHNMMPFLLLGIGVDDMFLIVGAWQNLTDEEKKQPIEIKIALALKHAGVSITVTSVTDIVAFVIGCSTVIPALSAFCAYAALGILGLYLLVSTFFVAVLTLDEQRIQDNRNSVICCYKHRDYVPNSCSKRDFVVAFMKDIYGPTLMKFPCKVIVVVVTLVLACVNIWSFSQLKQDFDLYDYLPSDSYAKDFIKAQLAFYPDRGYDANIYCDNMDYFKNHVQLGKMYGELLKDPHIQNGSLKFWYPAFTNYLRYSENNSYVNSFNMTDDFPASSEDFYMLLFYFLKQKEGLSYGRFLKFHQVPLDDGGNVTQIQASYIPLIHVWQTSSAGDIEAMESVRAITHGAGLIHGTCFAYGTKYLNNETNKVLRGELFRNLALAGVCVFIVTLLLIANLWTSILVFSCVAFTVIDVTGTLQFWSVTIDTASSILIILCVGLAVDYSAHVGHMFMTLLGHREDRAKATLYSIGPAVLNGGFSTFLAFVFLANSKSFGFVLFFKVFMTVVFFGLFHGLVYLPVILSWVGPSPYPSDQNLITRSTTQNGEMDGLDARIKNTSNNGGTGFLQLHVHGTTRYLSTRNVSTQVQMTPMATVPTRQAHQSDSNPSLPMATGATGVTSDIQGIKIDIAVNTAATDSAAPDSVKRCEVCAKQCVLCTLRQAQNAVQMALEDLSRSPEQSSQFCSCTTHRHLNSPRYTHDDWQDCAET